jgi:hypothetical protein
MSCKAEVMISFFNIFRPYALRLFVWGEVDIFEIVAPAARKLEGGLSIFIKQGHPPRALEDVFFVHAAAS